MLFRCNPRCGILSAVKIVRTLDKPMLQMIRPHSTVRWRLTLLYSFLFLLCGAALLAITYEFFIKFAFSYPPKAGRVHSTLGALDAALGSVRNAYLHRLLLSSGTALGIMALVCGVLGWVVAGRVLAPLRTITAATERISDSNLHERLAMQGPRDELRLLADTIDRLLERLETALRRSDGSSRTSHMNYGRRWR